jgi:hypothetical protein
MSFALNVSLSIGPAVLLAAAGILLAVRHRTWSTVVVAIGFSALLLSAIASAAVSAALSVQYAENREAALVSVTHEGWAWLTHYLGVGGMWLGAIALLFHACRRSPGPMSKTG